jgi:diacylglycerol kinase (ATP)
MLAVASIYSFAMMSALVLLNPHANGGRTLLLEQDIRAFLRTEYPGTRFVVTETIAAAHALIRDTPSDHRVILVGGDGTINRMLPAIVGTRREVGIVPLGTGNDVARALGIYGIPWKAALAHALKAATTAVDVGLLTMEGRDTPFLSSCTSGFDSAVALRALKGPAWLRGMPRYLLATLRELVHLRLWQLTVHVDGKPLRGGAALFASVLNTPTFGSGIPAVPHARISDGALDLLIAGRFNRITALFMLPRLLVGRHLWDSRIYSAPFSELAIHAAPPVPMAVDGEYLGEAAVITVRVLPAALLVVAKKAND